MVVVVLVVIPSHLMIVAQACFGVNRRATLHVLRGELWPYDATTDRQAWKPARFPSWWSGTQSWSSHSDAQIESARVVFRVGYMLCLCYACAMLCSVLCCAVFCAVRCMTRHTLSC